MRVHDFVLNRKYSYQNHSQLQIQNAHVVSYFFLKDKEEDSSHMGKKKKFVPKDFESMKGIHDTSASIFRSMLLHQVCRDLTASQFRLYVYCKSELYGKNRHDLDGFPAYVRDDPAYFTFNKAKWQKDGLYGLYSNSGQFYKDMAALIEHGFIDCVQSGYSTRTKSLYKFSTRWQLWGTENFTVPTSVMTTSMLRELNKKDGGSDDEK